MNENIGQLVRDSLDTLTDGATVPDGLLTRARRQHRRRVAAVRISAAAATGAVTAAAVTVAVILVGGVPSRPVVHRPAIANLTAYVVARAANALAAPASQDVVQARVNMPSGTLLSWSDASASKTVLATAAGQPIQAGGYLLRPARATVVTIDYRDRTWRKRSIPAAAAAPLTATVFPLQTVFGLELAQLTRGCAAWDAPNSAPFTFSWAGRIRQLLSCRSFRVAGRGQIDGLAAIKLIPAAATRPASISAVLWVSQRSYLPLRLEFAPVPGPSATGSASPSPGTPAATGYQVNLRWLPATSANLAMASVLPAPRGFTKVPWPAG